MKNKLSAIVLMLLIANSLFSQNPLDRLGIPSGPTAQFAYSLRQVSSSYTGPSITIRRNIDNAHADVLFNLDGEITPSSLVKFKEGILLTTSLGTTRTGTISTRQTRTGTITLQPNLNGTISGISNNTVSGSGTAFNTQLALNDRLYTVDGAYIGHIEAIGSATSVTLFVNSPEVGYTGAYRRQTTLVTGVGTLFTTELTVGDKLFNQVDGTFLGEVVEIISNTQLLVKSIGANAASGVGFARTTNTVTGVGTSFTTELSPGQLLIANNRTIGIVASITNNTELQLETRAGASVVSSSFNSQVGSIQLTDFVSLSSAFISHWYDQSGNGRHMSQPINSRQPRIANAGVLESVNSRIVARFITANQTFIHTEMPASWMNNTAYSVLSVSRPLSAASTDSYIMSTISSNGGPNSRVFHHGFRNNTTITLAHHGNDVNVTTLLGDELEIITAVKLDPAPNGARVFRNGALLASAANPSVFLNNVNPYGFGRFRDLFMDGYICEAIFFNSVLSDANRMTIESNQSDFFNIKRSVWTGSINTDWNNASNWLGGIPDASGPLTTFIPNTTNKPNVNGINAIVNRVEMESGATITVGTNSSLTINGTQHIIQTNAINAINGTIQIGGDWTFNPNIFSTSTVGALTINTSGTAVIQGAITIQNTLRFAQGKLNINGQTITVNGSIINDVSQGLIGSTASSLIVNASSASSLSMDQSTADTRTLNNLTLNAPGQTLNLLGDVRINGNLNISAGTYDLGANLSNRIAGGGTLTIGATGGIRIGGTNGFPANFTTHSIASGSNIEFYGANQTVSALNSSQNYFNLRLSGSGTKTFSNSITDIGSLYIASGVNLNLNAITTHTTGDLFLNNLSQVSGTWGNTGSDAANINSTFFTGSGRITVSNTTRTWNGSSSTNWNTAANWTPSIVPTATENVVIPNVSPAFQPTLSDNLACRSLTILSGATLTISGTNRLTVNANYISEGGIQTGTGTVVFIGGNRQITGSQTAAFSNVIIKQPASIFLNTNMTASTFNIGEAENGACSFSHLGSSALTVSGNINIVQSNNNSITRSWNINAATATVGGLISYTGTNTTTSRIQEIVITSGTLNANGGITFATVNNTGRRIVMSGGAGRINLQGALTLGGQQTLTSGTTGSTFSFSGNSAQTIPFFHAGSYRNIEIANTSPSGATLGAAVTATNVTGNINVVANATLNNGGFAIAGNSIATLTVADNANMVLSGTSSAFPTGFGNISLSPTSTVNYAGTGAQTIVAHQYGNLTSSSSGARTLANTGEINLKGNFTPGTNSYTITGSTINFSAETGTQNVAGFTYNNLSLTNTAQKQATGNITVNGVLNLAANPTSNAGHLEMTISYDDYATSNYAGFNASVAPEVTNSTSTLNNLNSYVLTMGPNSTTTGPGDVTGKIRRTSISNATTYTFGNANMQMTFNTGTGMLPTQMTVVSTIGSRGRHVNKTTSVQRLYQVLRTGGTSGSTFTIRFPYMDTELDTNTESNLVIWDHHLPYGGATPHEHGKTNQSTTQNWLELATHGIEYLALELDAANTKYWMLSSKESEPGNIWLGAATNAWNLPQNWNGGRVPTADSLVIIPSTAARTLDLAGSINTGTMEIRVGATVNAGSATLTLTGGPLINGGAGTWLNEGTFNAGTSTVIITNANATIAGTTTFNNLTIDAGSTTTMQGNSNTTIAGTFTNNGTLNAATFANTINYAGSNVVVPAPNGTPSGYHSLTLSGTGTAVMPSSLSLKGTYTQDQVSVNFTNNNSTVTFDGSSAQQITSNLVSKPAVGFNNLTINNSSGVSSTIDLSVGNTLQLQTGTLAMGTDRELSVAGAISRSSGNLQMNANNTLQLNGSSAQSIPANTFVNNELSNLNVNNSAGVTLGGTLRLLTSLIPTTGVLTTGGNLRLVSTSTGTARIAQGTPPYISGNVIAERFIPSTAGRMWRFLSSPVSGTTFNDWRGEIFVTGPGGSANGFDNSTNNNHTIFGYNEPVAGNLNNGWVGPTNTSNPIQTGKGYRVFVRGDRSNPAFMTNNPPPANDVTMNVVGPVHSGDVSMPVTFTSTSVLSDDGWNLVGNPYPSQISWDAFHDNGRVLPDTTSGADYQNLEPTVWVYDPATTSYVFWNALANDGTLPNGIIASGQSFWVKSVASPTSMTLKEQYKVAGSLSNEIFKTIPNSSFSIRLMRDSLTSDDVIVKYIQGSTKVRDMFDVLKLPGSISISAWGPDNVQLALSSLPLQLTSNDTIRLSVSGSVGTYQMLFNNARSISVQDQVYLVDNFTSQMVNLNTTSSYSFNITSNNSSQGMNRFYIVVASNNSIPVDLMHFGAVLYEDKQVRINWTTASEINTSHFEVERSADGKLFNTLNRVGATGSKGVLTSYTSIDEAPQAINYYRLKMVDNDGTFKYSQTRIIKLEEQVTPNAVALYPVPVAEQLTIAHKQTGIKEVKLYGMWGQLLSTQRIDNQQATQLDMSKYAAGMYIVEVTDENGQITREQIVKE